MVLFFSILYVGLKPPAKNKNVKIIMLINCSELARADTLSMATPTENVQPKILPKLTLPFNCCIKLWCYDEIHSKESVLQAQKTHFYRGRQFYLRNQQLQTWLKNTG